ncbi:MAG TPA: DUF1853 family protein, partial [Pseudomonadales bacterium]|nr:DUF1853 family protein [Pseudomonadales bacterium]
DLPLPSPKHPHHFRLGQHFEALLNTWLADSAAFQLRAANLQVQDGKRTVGEFDFLVDHDGETEHWEAAVKFYLGTGDTRELANWYGPNTEDRFDIKYNRLISRQLQLASDPHAEALLNVRNIHVHRSRCFMKGRLFYPRAQWMGHAVQPPMVANPTHERGWWLAEGDFLPAFEDTGHRFVYLPKQLWLSPLLADDIAAPLSAWEIQELIESPQAEQAIHVAEVTDAGEISRGFIVKNQWIETVT